MMSTLKMRQLVILGLDWEGMQHDMRVAVVKDATVPEAVVRG